MPWHRSGSSCIRSARRWQEYQWKELGVAVNAISYESYLLVNLCLKTLENQAIRHLIIKQLERLVRYFITLKQDLYLVMVVFKDKTRVKYTLNIIIQIGSQTSLPHIWDLHVICFMCIWVLCKLLFTMLLGWCFLSVQSNKFYYFSNLLQQRFKIDLRGRVYPDFFHNYNSKPKHEMHGSCDEYLCWRWS